MLLGDLLLFSFLFCFFDKDKNHMTWKWRTYSEVAVIFLCSSVIQHAHIWSTARLSSGFLHVLVFLALGKTDFLKKIKTSNLLFVFLRSILEVEKNNSDDWRALLLLLLLLLYCWIMLFYCAFVFHHVTELNMMLEGLESVIKIESAQLCKVRRHAVFSVSQLSTFTLRKSLSNPSQIPSWNSL